MRTNTGLHNILLVIGMTIFLAGLPGCTGFRDSVDRQHQKINRGLTNLDQKIHTGVDKTPVVKSNTSKQSTNTLHHKVKYKGETFSIISNWYTGDKSNWRSIADLNPALNPDKLFIGSTVWIPENIVVTGKPLPKWYVQKQNAVSTTKTNSPSSPPDTEEETELFGPRDYDE